jgi:hypothetical protein
VSTATSRRTGVFGCLRMMEVVMAGSVGTAAAAAPRLADGSREWSERPPRR